MFQSFLVVSMPESARQLQRWRTFFCSGMASLQLRPAQDASDQLDCLAPGRFPDIDLIHPTRPGYGTSLAARLHEGRCFVAEPVEFPVFVTAPPREPTNLLFFAGGFNCHQFRIKSEDGHSVAYVRLSNVAKPRPALREITTQLGDRLYCEQRGQVAGNCPVFYLTVAGERSGSPFLMNPAVLSIRRSGNGLACIGSESSQEADVLTYLLDPECVNSVHVAWNWGIECRRQLLRHLVSELHRGGERILSTVEALLLGPASCSSLRGCDFEPFMTLDHLGGRFIVVTADEHLSRVGWERPLKESSNQAWLANHSLKVWGGMACCSVRRPPVKLAEGHHEDLAPVRADREAGGPAGELLSMLREKLPCDTRLAQFLIDAVKELAGGPWDALAVNARAARQEPAVFLERLLSAHFSPRSDVLVAVPDVVGPAGSEDRETFRDLWVDLVRTPAWGHRNFFTHVIQRLYAPMPIPERLELVYRSGWWHDWFDALWSHSREFSLRFVPALGFVLGRSRLGEPLGRPDSDYSPSRDISF